MNNSSGASGSTTGKVYVGPGTKQTIYYGASGTYQGTPIVQEVDTMTISAAKARFFDEPGFEQRWTAALAANGYTDVTPIKAKMLYDMAVDGASTFYSESSGKRKITPEQYVQWYSKEQGMGGGPSTTVTKYLYQPEEIQTLIDKTLASVLGRSATKEENKEFYTAIQKMIDEGTVTVTKKVGGKTISETTPGYSKERAEAVITSKLQKSAPEDIAQKKSLDFNDFLTKLGG